MVFMKRHFLFFRHGQTNENEAGERYGSGIDAWLTELGVEQAIKLSDFFKDKNVQIAYSSPYRRAVDTAKIALRECGDIEIITKDALREAAFGFWYTDKDKEKKIVDDNFNRIKECLDQIVENTTYTNIAISSHGGVTRALCWACGLKVAGIKNCECFHFILDENGWHYVENFVP